MSINMKKTLETLERVIKSKVFLEENTKSRKDWKCVLHYIHKKDDDDDDKFYTNDKYYAIAYCTHNGINYAHKIAISFDFYSENSLQLNKYSYEKANLEYLYLFKAIDIVHQSYLDFRESLSENDDSLIDIDNYELVFNGIKCIKASLDNIKQVIYKKRNDF